MKAARTRQFLVTIEVPPGATVSQVRRYIDDALGVMMNESSYAGTAVEDIDPASVKVEALPAPAPVVR